MRVANRTISRQRINDFVMLIPLGEALRMAIYERLERLDGCSVRDKTQAIVDLLDELSTLPDLIAEDEELYEELVSPEGRSQLRRDIVVWRNQIRNLLMELTWEKHNFSHFLPKSIVKAAYQKWDIMHPDSSLISGEMGPLFCVSI